MIHYAYDENGEKLFTEAGSFTWWKARMRSADMIQILETDTVLIQKWKESKFINDPCQGYTILTKCVCGEIENHSGDFDKLPQTIKCRKCNAETRLMNQTLENF